MTQIDALKTDEIQNYEIEHQEEVRRLAGECMVILENDGVLPLQAGTKKIALFGTGARHTIKGGTGSGDVNVRENISIAQGLERAGFKFVTEGWLDQYDRLYADAQEAYAKKLNEFTEKTGKPSMLYAFETPFEEPEQPEITEADVKEADAAIYVISRNSGEGKDRRAEKGDYYLSDRELQNIRFMTEHYKNCIVLLNVGGVIDLTSLKAIEGVQAIMLVGQTGNMGGYAVADVLTAKTIPSGKLTDTWARSYEDYPSSATFSHRDGNLDDEYYSDGIYVGYRYFDTFGVMPLYCFGYGKSYTEFEMKTINVTADEKQVQVEVEVTNIGDKYPGKEIVQVYYSAPDGIMEKPTQELAGFAKTKLLAPGEKDVVTITFATTDMASFDAYDAAWVMEEGEYTIRVGNSSRNTEAVAVIDLDEQVTTLQLKRLMRDTIAVRELHHMIPIFDIEFDFGVPAIPFRIMLQAENFKKELVEYEVMRRTLMDKRKDEVLTLEDVKTGNATLDELTAQLTVEEMAELCVGTERRNGDGNVIGSAPSSCVPGCSGETPLPDLLETRKEVPKIVIQADGPAGLRLETPCTAIPIATTLAQSWDMDLIHRMGELVGEEMKQLHVDLWLAPGSGCSIRNPALWTGASEYYSEDPVLTGTFVLTTETRRCSVSQKEGNNNQTRLQEVIQEDNRVFTRCTYPASVLLRNLSERSLR
ncbi:MAG: glycoside hydrolase family 3 C-terminal domain-containing protein [Mediterraneibacter faecis]